MIARVSNSQNAFLTYQKHNPGDYLHLSWKPTKDRHMFLNLLNTIQRVISKTTRHTKSMAKCNLFKFDENLIPNIMYCLLMLNLSMFTYFQKFVKWHLSLMRSLKIKVILNEFLLDKTTL